MPSALIGHTGFVGGNLARQRRFDDGYNSKNIEAIAGRSYDLVVCSGAPAEKWKANLDPEADRRALDRLWEGLGAASAEKVILISTVDVYADPYLVDEDDDVDPERSTAYGRHRRELERRVSDHFDAMVVRLPALFGEGLKKNIIYDFLHENNVDRIDCRSSFQFYGVGRLWSDIERARRAGVPVINVATEPMTVREVAAEAFGFDFDRTLDRDPPRYDFRSKHAHLYGGSGGYLVSKADVLADMRAFVATQQEQKRCA